MKKLSKKQQEALDYQRWLDSLQKLAPNFARETYAPAKKRETLNYVLTRPPGRAGYVGKSVTTAGGVGAKKESTHYTGDKMLGVGMLHKSNLVPVFKEEDAKDLATMRRS
jgi:hypothetical protein